jgi:hypothetical protein
LEFVPSFSTALAVFRSNVLSDECQLEASESPMQASPSTAYKPKRKLLVDDVSGFICSYEHEIIFAAIVGANIAQVNWQISTDGAEPMDSAHQAMMVALRSIRDQADSVLRQIEQSQEPRSMRWVCKGCRYTKHFTRPVALEGAGRCPRCKSTEFRPIVKSTPAR